MGYFDAIFDGAVEIGENFGRWFAANDTDPSVSRMVDEVVDYHLREEVDDSTATLTYLREYAEQEAARQAEAKAQASKDMGAMATQPETGPRPDALIDIRTGERLDRPTAQQTPEATPVAVTPQQVDQTPVKETGLDAELLRRRLEQIHQGIDPDQEPEYV